MNTEKIVEYNETKNRYSIISEGLMKNPETREWQKCVIYRQYQELNDLGEYVDIQEDKKLTFVREKIDFLNKFTLCLNL